MFHRSKEPHKHIYGTPAEAVTYRKQSKILSTALCYLKHTGRTEVPLSFDVIEVVMGSGSSNPQVNHISNAFGRQ